MATRLAVCGFFRLGHSTSGRAPCCLPAHKAPRSHLRTRSLRTCSKCSCSACPCQSLKQCCHSPFDSLGRLRAPCHHNGRLRRHASPVEHVERILSRGWSRSCGWKAHRGTCPRFAMLRRSTSGSPRHTVERTKPTWTAQCCCKHSVTKKRSAPNSARQARRGRTRNLWQVGHEAVEFVLKLATVKTMDVPTYMEFKAMLAWHRRWTKLDSRVCALSLVGLDVLVGCAWGLGTVCLPHKISLFGLHLLSQCFSLAAFGSRQGRTV